MDISTQISDHLSPLKYLFEKEEVEEIVIHKEKELHAMSNGKWIKYHESVINFNWIRTLSNLLLKFTGQSTTPLLSATLPTGERVQLVNQPLAPDFPSVTIRLPARNRLTIENIVNFGAFKPIESELPMPPLNWAEALVKEQKNILIAGQTGSGKTTLTRALMDLVPDNERIITIEDSRELFLNQPLNVPLIYSSSGDKTNTTPKELFKSCLRMRPDRILLAELRGGETYNWLQSVLSGHNGSITSCHANNSESAIVRVASMFRENIDGQGMPYEEVTKQITLAIDVIIVMKDKKIIEVSYP